jgi:uncharacterized protein (TIGR00725 family)
MSGARRLPVVAVIGSGSEPHSERTSLVGSWLATKNVHLLTGGGGGVMESVSRAFAETKGRRGMVIGIIPGGADGAYKPKIGYPNRWVDIAIFTHLPLSGSRGTEPLSRNHINILSADVIIALPGGTGTASEVALALRYERPLIAFIDTKDDIEGIAEEVLIEPDFEAVKKFVESNVGGTIER